MIGAIAATFLFATAAIFGQRLSRMMGGIAANFWRLLLAVSCLGVVCGVFFRDQFPAHPAVFWWFFASGIIGFGIGDVALFLAYFRIGARLTILLNLCLAPVFGALGEYVWMGATVTGAELACIAVIVIGIALALKPDQNHPPRIQRGALASGICCAVIAGMGQGFGAVVSRYAGSVAIDAGVQMNGMGGGTTQAFVRTLGGLLVALICHAGYLWVSARSKPAIAESGAPRGAALKPGKTAGFRARNRFFPLWLAGAALTGPVIGVSCFQWALQTEKSAIVLAITATSPLLVTVLARVFEKEKTPPMATLGSLISVAGVIAICLLKLRL